MSVDHPAHAGTNAAGQMLLLPGSEQLPEGPEGKRREAKAGPVSKSTLKQEVAWIDPKLLLDHPANAELFGEHRLHTLDDLLMSIETGFDHNRPIKAVRRPDGSLVMVDGHRRRRAAVELGHESVPLLLSSFAGEKEERLEMLTANLVRNRKYRSVGLGTAVRLVQALRPREVRRGRPRKENVAQGARISAEAKREYYAGLLGISVKRFRKADYVLRHGTREERAELDTGPRSTSAIYKAVHARVTGAGETQTLTPGELAKMARDAARAAVFLVAAAGEKAPVAADEAEAGVDSLLNLARLEATGEIESGATASEGLKLLRAVLG